MPTERQLQRLLEQTHAKWHVESAKVLIEIGEFMVATGKALGTISRDEAVDAVQQYAKERIERLR